MQHTTTQQPRWFTVAAKSLFSIFLIGMLCGCTREMPAESIGTETAAPMTSTAPQGLYTPSPLENQTGGAVKNYPLGLSDARDVCRFADGLLIFSGEETTLTLLAGENLAVIAQVSLGSPLSTQDPSFRIHGSTLSFYDSAAKQTVVLDGQLTAVTRIDAPPALSGIPLLSDDRNRLYYCTESALMVWDLESGIRRTVKEMAYEGQQVMGLHDHGSIVEVMAQERLFLAADTGRLVKRWEEELTLKTFGDVYYAAFPMGFETALVFGFEGNAQILLPQTSGDTFFLPENHSLISAWQPSEKRICLDAYDLNNGHRTSRLTLETGSFPLAIAGDGSQVCILMDTADGDILYCWDPALMPVNDGTDYTGEYITSPDDSHLAACRSYARELEDRYGIRILLGQEAVQTQPWDYDLTAQTQPAVAQRELEKLDTWLSQFPEQILTDTAGNFDSLNLCLVRSVTGSAESGSLAAATGVQFLEGKDAYVAIATGPYAQQGFSHELFHLLETHIFGHSIAFDQWESLNPAGFQYDYSYSANAQRDSGIYLHADSRCFIDTYSMSFPKEDRARIFEYALLPNCGHLFESSAMQAKLRCISQGLREAYGLEETQERFPWEQYLK